MSVEVAGVRKAVEISWNPSGSAEQPPEGPPPGYPAHPIVLPGEPDHTLPGDLPEIDNTLPEPEQPVDPDYGVDEGAHPDNTLPGDLPHPDQGLPGEQPKPEHPIYLPPYIDNSLPQPQPRPEHPIVLPPDLEDGLTDEQKEKLKAFMFGNLPPFTPPDYVAPMHAEGEFLAVQVFAQGQDGDWSNTAVMPNDGRCVLTYPEGFSGSSYVEVRSLFGDLVDCGTIQVEAS